jgi:HlyD family secretion protein
LKTWRIALLLVLPLAALSIASCSPFGNGKANANQQLVKVARGDLTVKVSGSGNLEVIASRRLAFSAPGQVASVYVTEGQKVAKGDRIASLVTDTLELAVSQAQLGLSQAQVGIVNADVAVKAAQQVLDAALGRPTYTEVETAQTDVDEAKSYLQYITTNMADTSTVDAQAWATALAYAQAKLAAAEAKLRALLTNYDTEEIALKRLQVTAATQSRDLAAQSLKYAQNALDQAQRQLDDATIFAPFDGVVARLNVKEEDSVSPAVIIAEVVDSSAMQLDVQVDEIDIVDVYLGQKALVSVDALPNLTIDGTVSSISVLPALQSGVVVYDTRISFKAPNNKALKPGMSASADVIVSERKNVLLVPDRAIGKNDKGDAIVTAIVDGKTEQKVVTTGASDGIQTEIVAGLNEGDTVVVERSNQAAPGLF